MTGWQGQRGTRHDRGYGREWTKLRNAAMVRDRYLCQPCAKVGRVAPATEVDHVIPKSQGGTDDHDNLQAICKSCHADKTTREAAQAQGRRVKQRLAFDAQGFPIWPD